MATFESVEQMWAALLSGGLTNAEDTTYSSWHFCDNELDANELAELVVIGAKRATAGALVSYESEGEPLPKVGDVSVITDWNGRPRAVIRTTSVDVVPFRDVNSQFAAAEGEGDRSLGYWRDAHRAAFSRELASIGLEFTEDMLVVCERFEVVFTDSP